MKETIRNHFKNNKQIARINYLVLKIIFLLIILFGAGCNKGKEDFSNCEYSYDHSATKFKWTAFKLTEKVGVNGSFDKISIEGTRDRQISIPLVFENLRFNVDLSSINSGQNERDKKILKYFFGNLKDSTEISGTFSKIKISNNFGTADLNLKMNSIEKIVPVKIMIQNNSDLELRASIDLLNWDMGEAIKSLNKECYDLHKGKDGVSKLWPEVELEVNTKLKATCK